jgi:hypothetical protein
VVAAADGAAAVVADGEGVVEPPHAANRAVSAPITKIMPKRRM